MSGQNTPGNDLLGDPNSRVKKLSLTDRIATLERENAKKARLLQECATHLKGYKMSMLARTPERLRAAIEAALQPKVPT